MRPRDRLRLALETGYSTKTIRNWELGKRVAEATNIALLRAVSELGLMAENEIPRSQEARTG